MSQENHEARIAALEKAVITLAALGKRENEDRLEMCMTIMSSVVDVKNAHNEWVKTLAEKTQLFDAKERQELLDHVARVETVFERIEKFIRDAGPQDGPAPG